MASTVGQFHRRPDSLSSFVFSRYRAGVEAVFESTVNALPAGGLTRGGDDADPVFDAAGRAPGAGYELFFMDVYHAAGPGYPEQVPLGVSREALVHRG